VKERPILMNAEMVRAVLDDRKTQTRRVIKPQPKFTSGMGSQIIWKFPKPPAVQCHDVNFMLKRFCPYGKPGDRLWVRECFWWDRRSDKTKPPQDIIYSATAEWAMNHNGKIIRCRYMPARPFDNGFMTHEDSTQQLEANKFWSRKPSIHMPRWASRINLEVVDIRVERASDISVEDIQSEGLEFMQHGKVNGHFTPCDEIRAYHAWQTLWDSINKKRGYGLETKAWVWVVEFKMI